ncbi:hypothetical protein [Halobacillus halophilus]|uniref:hypothetical protein n=1 Tax=Halobacillus halophilus TaxID=1570 RepID=UPI001CD54C8E|nr:hypothetical protein [Halobacillus halophilus]MCA1010700.1 hypothetical protein [Halobacillus halophilus]
MKYYVQLVDQSQKDQKDGVKPDRWHQVNWDWELGYTNHDQLFKDIENYIRENKPKYQLTDYQVNKFMNGKLEQDVVIVRFVEIEDEQSYRDSRHIRHSVYRKEAYKSIYDYLNDYISKDKINTSIPYL